VSSRERASRDNEAFEGLRLYRYTLECIVESRAVARKMRQCTRSGVRSQRDVHAARTHEREIGRLCARWPSQLDSHSSPPAVPPPPNELCEALQVTAGCVELSVELLL
jgi:hypothetical protein